MRMRIKRVNYEEAVNYIEEIPKFTKKTALDHTRRLLDLLDHPERDLKIIHVAGTNGKGSVCSFLNSMLMEGGYRCGLFTSPHLVKINERYLINGQMAEDETFLKAFQRVMEAVKTAMAQGDTHPTYFETLLLMGLLIFRDARVDYLILETGMGGRLDATNVVERPLACIITSISLDHTEYLGDTIEKIAGEKAGIIKPKIPVIYDGHCREAAAVICRRAEELDSPAYGLTEDMYRMEKADRRGLRFQFRYGQEPAETLEISSIAEYQMMNASLAYFTMKKLMPVHGIPKDALVRGIRRASWPCRMETVMDGVIIDGAHNEDGVAQFIRTAAHFKKENEITILFSAVSDKRYPDMIREIAEGIHPQRVIVTEIAGDRRVSAEELKELFRKAGCRDVRSEVPAGAAFDTACRLKGEGMLFCVGSLYLAGELKDWIAKETETC